jgi:hypothetical protein
LIDKKVVTGEKEMADFLNKFLPSKCSGTRQRTGKEKNGTHHQATDLKQDQATKERCCPKARWHHSWPAPEIRRACDSTGMIFNMVVGSKKSSQDWKMANVTPIFKSVLKAI